VAAAKRWSKAVTTKSNALDLEPGVFTQTHPAGIAASLKRSAEKSTGARRLPTNPPCPCSISISIAPAKTCPPGGLRLLEKAKGELRKLFESR